MTRADARLGAPEWIAGALALLRRRGPRDPLELRPGPRRPRVRLACARPEGGWRSPPWRLILLEPLLTGTRPRRGANAFAVVADNSQSLQIRDGGEPTRPAATGSATGSGRRSAWQTRLGQDFDVRRYVFDSHLRAVDGFDALAFDGSGSSLAALARGPRAAVPRPAAGRRPAVHRRQPDRRRRRSTGRRPAADLSRRPAVARASAATSACANVSVSQTNFESAPVVVRADVAAVGFRGESIVATVVDEDGPGGRASGGEAASGDGRPLELPVPVPARCARG